MKMRPPHLDPHGSNLDPEEKPTAAYLVLKAMVISLGIAALVIRLGVYVETHPGVPDHSSSTNLQCTQTARGRWVCTPKPQEPSVSYPDLDWNAEEYFTWSAYQ